MARAAGTDGDGGGKLLDSSSQPLSLRLLDALDRCSQSLASVDHSASEFAIAAFVDLLEPLADSQSPVPVEASEDALFTVLGYIVSPDSDQMVIDALTLQLPKVVVKFCGLSGKCRQTGGAIFDSLVAVCSPRDMLSILSEALDMNAKNYKGPCYLELIVSRISKVLICIQRREVEQIKELLPVIMSSLFIASAECVEEDKDFLCELFVAAIDVGMSLQEICRRLEGRKKEVLRAILGLYAMQLIALISRNIIAQDASVCNSIVTNVVKLLPFCGFSYVGLITGQDVDAVMDSIEDKDFLSFFSIAIDGAVLSVLWCFISDEVAKVYGEHPVTVMKELHDNQGKRWRALGMLRHILASVDIPWKLICHCIDFIMIMMDGAKAKEPNYDTEFTCDIPSIVIVLKAIQRVIVGAQVASLRKKSFDALKKVLSDFPVAQRVDILKFLVMTSNIPSMTALLIDVVRIQAVVGRSSSNPEIGPRHAEATISPFWTGAVLDIVDLVLRPSKGGPPSLPEESEPVVSALNLYRFILIAESTGGTNQTGALSESSLRKAYSEWLLPLRTLVSGIIQVEGRGELAFLVECALNPVQCVLHRCIELVEDCLRNAK